MHGHKITRRFELERATLLGVVHLPPLPGSPRFAEKSDRQSIIDAARRDAYALLEGGLDGVIVENFGDIPFLRADVGPEVVATMTWAALAVREEVGEGPLLGLNVLRNDARAALAIAASAQGNFVRVNVHTGVQYTDQGSIEGDAGTTLRYRRAIDAEGIEILADVGVKHATPPAGFDLADSARDTAYRGLADGLIVTGSGTGEETDFADLAAVREAVPDRPLFVGSGVTIEHVREALEIASGVIVGTALKVDDDIQAPVDIERVRAFVDRARS